MNLLTPQSIAAMYTPKGIKPPQWFNQMYGDAFPEMTAFPEFWRSAMWAYVPGWNSRGDLVLRDDLDNYKASNQIITKQGKAEDYVDSAGDHRQGTKILPVDTKPFSVIVYLADPASADFGAVISNVPNSTSWNNRDSFSIQVMSNDHWRFNCNLSNGSQRIDTAAATLESGAQIIAGTRVPDGTAIKFYYNGTIDDTMEANETSDTMLWEDPMIVGGYFDLTDSRFRATHEHFYSVVLHREVQQSEIDRLNEDPWLPFRPALV